MKRVERIEDLDLCVFRGVFRAQGILSVDGFTPTFAV
jgi:hypothetical protein